VAARQQACRSIADLTTELFDWTVRTNLYALFWITKAALPHLGPGASIITTASQQAYDPAPYLLDYAPTKAGIIAFTKSLAKQVASKGIRVNSVAPGPFWTPLQASGGRPLEQLPEFGSETPFGRPGQPAEIAPVYVMLAAAESSYASGQVIGDSGGHGNP
jgi:NAD(P)-dependent dehydrogenase (short-subunit alcohol dehydrogenase family)